MKQRTISNKIQMMYIDVSKTFIIYIAKDFFLLFRVMKSRKIDFTNRFVSQAYFSRDILNENRRGLGVPTAATNLFLQSQNLASSLLDFNAG